MGDTFVGLVNEFDKLFGGVVEIGSGGELILYRWGEYFGKSGAKVSKGLSIDDLK